VAKSVIKRFESNIRADSLEDQKRSGTRCSMTGTAYNYRISVERNLLAADIGSNVSMQLFHTEHLPVNDTRTHNNSCIEMYRIVACVRERTKKYPMRSSTFVTFVLLLSINILHVKCFQIHFARLRFKN